MTRAELAVWDVYFATITGMRFHPRNVENMVSCDRDFQQRIINQCAIVADMMLQSHRARDAGEYRRASAGLDDDHAVRG